MKEKAKQTASALKLSIATAIFLSVVKVITGLFTHSMAVTASALDSIMDVASSSVNLIAAREAAKPPDDDHAYGHGKIESLASLFQSMLIAVSGGILLVEAVKRFAYGSYVRVIPAGIMVMTFSVLVTFLLVLRLRFVAKKNGSLLLDTEKLHFSMDILTNGGAILALVLVELTSNVVWDLLVSAMIVFYVFRTSIGIFRTSVDELLDRSLPPAAKHEIEQLIYAHHPSVVGVHNFRSRRVRDKIFLDFHIEIRGEDDFKKAHLMTESIIKKIENRYAGADVTVHYDPEGES